MPDPSDDSARPAKRARIEENDAAATNTTTTATALDTVLVSATAPTPAPIPSAPATVDADLEREVRAGITEYVCPDNLGFTGVLKQRYTDFLVNEIGLDGEVVHLKSTEVPRKGKGGRENGMDGGVVMVAEAEGTAGPVTKLIEEGGDAATESVSVEHALEQTESATPQNDGQHEHVTIEGDEPLSEEDRTTLHSIFGEDTTRQIVALVGQVRKREHKKAKDFKAVIAPPISNKETRTEAHKCLRRIFPNLLESSMEQDQSIRIKATPPAERKGKGRGGNQGRRGPEGGRQRGQTRWEDLGGDFLHFTLYKENKDTMEVVGFLDRKSVV